jgi:formate C-acetyltransferase
MNERVAALRKGSLEAEPCVSAERADLMTDFYLEEEGRHSAPVLRGLAFHRLCEKKAIYIGGGELMVGERGEAPKAVPTYPEIVCHSVEDLEALRSRPLTRYRVDDATIEIYRKKIIPFWRGRTMRDRMLSMLPEEWRLAYGAGIFTESMEQRAPGRAALDDKIYRRGMLDFKGEIAAAMSRLDFDNDPMAFSKRESLRGFDVACGAIVRLAERHAEAAEKLIRAETDAHRRSELLRIAQACRHVPARAPKNFFEALQSYWFCHIGAILEMNGWGAPSPGHLDQHLWPFFKQEMDAGSLTRESAKELLECFFVKFNNHPAPPKVGVAAAESGTYADFADISLAGLLSDGGDGSNDLTLIMLEAMDGMRMLQPGGNVQISRKTPDAVLREALKVVRGGRGFPSIVNADGIVEEQLRMGKTLEDSRTGGCSGCVEVGAFGKEACVPTGYMNLPKILELALHDGFGANAHSRLGPSVGDASSFRSIDDVLAAFQKQLRHFVDVKMRGNRMVERLYAESMPAPFLSVLTSDCIAKGMDYNAGGARYNNTYIHAVGIGTTADALAGMDMVVFRERSLGMAELVRVLDGDFEGSEDLRQALLARAPKYGNDDDRADGLMSRVFGMAFDCIDGRPNTRGGAHRLDMLSTTCHVYFGSACGATADGRRAGAPLSEGISPVQGADRRGPWAAIRSAGKMDHVKTGGTLLNIKLSPALLEGDGGDEGGGGDEGLNGLNGLAGLVRDYFRMDGHHVQFNAVGAETLREARDAGDGQQGRAGLMVGVAGYSDYFCDLGPDLQEDVIARTEHTAWR